jgi:membrane-associated protein
MVYLFLNIFNTPNFQGFIEKFGYLGILVWFLTFDQLTPLPEELSLLTIGYLVSVGIFNPVLAGIASVAAFIVIDTIYFWLSKKGSKLVKKKKKPGGLWSYMADRLERNIGKTIITVCFIPRMRLWAPIVAGSTKITYKRFILFDVCGLAPFTAIYIALGYIFHQSIGKVFTKVKSVQTIIFFAVIIVIGIIVGLAIRRFLKQRKLNGAN